MNTSLLNFKSSSSLLPKNVSTVFPAQNQLFFRINQQNDHFNVTFGSSKKIHISLTDINTGKIIDPNRIKIFTGSSNPDLARDISKSLGIKLGKIDLSSHSNGEHYVRIDDSVTNKKTFVIQSTSRPADKHINQLEFISDALKRHFAKLITLIIPHYGYARGDRPVLPGESIPAKVIAKDLVNHGANNVILVDIHAKQIEGYFDVPVINLTASPVLIGYLKRKNLDLDKVVVVSPDLGGVKRAKALAKELTIIKQQQDKQDKTVEPIPMVVIDKTRNPKTKEITELCLIGEKESLEGKTAIIVDDMIDTASTLCKGADFLKQFRVEKVIAMATHGIFSGKAVDKIDQSKIDEVVVTDTIKLSAKAKRSDKIKQVSIAPIIAKAIKCLTIGESLEGLTM